MCATTDTALDFFVEMGDTGMAFYPGGALEANRGGQLGAEQLTKLHAQLDGKHGGILGAVARGIDPMGRDVRDGTVESIEGAMTKHTAQMEYGTRRYIRLANRDVGQRQFRAPADIYEFAPDAGIVRLFYLPRSRWIVNLERLPDPPVGDPSLGSLNSLGAEWNAARKDHDAVGQAEAMAKLGAMERELETYMPKDVPPQAASPDPAALAKEIIGTWESPFGTVTFKQDGAVIGRLATGMGGDGRWSVDADGRVRAEGMGTSVVVDATLRGDELTLALDGRAMKLKRSAGN
jgi:hypothetical protein